MACPTAPGLPNPSYPSTSSLIGDEYIGWVSCGSTLKVFEKLSTCPVESQPPGQHPNRALDIPGNEYIGWVDRTSEQRHKIMMKPPCKCTYGRQPEYGVIEVYQDRLASREEKSSPTRVPADETVKATGGYAQHKTSGNESRTVSQDVKWQMSTGARVEQYIEFKPRRHWWQRILKSPRRAGPTW